MPADPSANAIFRRTTIFELFGYLVASALALALDTGVYAAALSLGLPLSGAAVLGFAAGVTCAYLCSLRFVFRTHRLHDRSSEFAVFVAIGLAGLLLTEALLWLFVTRWHLPPVPAKLATAGFVFIFNFGVRKALLFSAPRARGASDSRLEPLL